MGLILGTVIGLIVAASSKTITGEPYFYPLIPFNWIKLKNLIFRTRISNKVQ
ncbi:hypothetical protein B0H42_001101 [Clostridium saccharobutylicum]|nr:hypothetical protein [Clostridium saccharobutylicum]